MPFFRRFLPQVAIVLFLTLNTFGCGGQSISTKNPGQEPPHEGMLVPMPAGKGYVEVVKKTGTAPISSEVTFYLYRDGKYTPFDSTPESPVLVLDSKKSVKLKVVDDAMVTPEGPVLFGKRDVEGFLRFELDGESIQVVIGGR